jgi:hypothetical protein
MRLVPVLFVPVPVYTGAGSGTGSLQVLVVEKLGNRFVNNIFSIGFLFT